jgi:hypothetical protein
MKQGHLLRGGREHMPSHENKLPIYKLQAIWYHLFCQGDVAQLGERDNRTVEVRGSSPLISTQHTGASHIHSISALQIANAYGIVETQWKITAMSRSSRSTPLQRAASCCKAAT